MLNENLSVALAIHPIREVYYKEPAREAMQAIFDDQRYNLNICVTGFKSKDAHWGLYVNAPHVVSSYLNNHPNIALERRKKYGHDYDIINPEDLTALLSKDGASLLEVMLMGGETTPVEGCHHAAFNDLIHWFFNLSPDSLKTLKIVIKFDTLFFSSRLSDSWEFNGVDSKVMDNHPKI